MKVPCKGCEERSVRCHSYCERYKEYEKDNERKRQEKTEDSFVKSFLIDNRYNTMAKSGRKMQWRELR